jgi:hypothetical protein
MRVQRRWWALAPVAVAVLAGCGGEAPSEGIPSDWTLRTDFVTPGQTVWIVGDGESVVGVRQKTEGLSATMSMPLDTEEQWVEALTAIAKDSVYGGGGPEVAVVDVDFDGAAVSQEYLSGNGDVQTLAVYIYDHGTDSLWIASASPGDGDIDPWFIDGLVQDFSPDLVASASAPASASPEPSEDD